MDNATIPLLIDGDGQSRDVIFDNLYPVLLQTFVVIVLGSVTPA